MSKFLDLAAVEDGEMSDAYDSEDINHESVGRPVDPGPSGRDYFNRVVDSMMARYNQMSQRQVIPTEESDHVPDGTHTPLLKVFIVDFFSG